MSDKPDSCESLAISNYLSVCWDDGPAVVIGGGGGQISMTPAEAETLLALLPLYIKWATEG